MPLRTTTYNLPNLRYLTATRLIVACTYCGVFYVIFIFHATTLVQQYMSGNNSYYSEEMFGQVSILFLLAGMAVLMQLRRIIMAVSLPRTSQDGTVIAQYQIDLTPVEASFLINAATGRQLVYLILNELQKKGYIYIQSRNNNVLIRQHEGAGGLTYYEQAFMQHLFVDQHEIITSIRKLQQSRALHYTESQIYAELTRRGYLEKMTPGQEFLTQYGTVASVLFFALPYALLVLIVVFDFIGTTMYGIPSTLYPVSDIRLWLVGIEATLFLIPPFIMYFTNIYSTRGSQKYREVLGLYLYLRKILIGRWKTPQHLAQSDIERFLPYAEAFDLAPPGTSLSAFAKVANITPRR